MATFQDDVRLHGDTPAAVAVLHGGPGGAGEVEPFARQLGRRGHAVLEPFQTSRSVDGQVEELGSQIERHGDPPIAIIGWSWGAWLGCLFAARYPSRVRRLVLVGSGPLEARYAQGIRATKNARLTDRERAVLADLRSGPDTPDQVARLIELGDVTDSYRRDATPQPHVAYDAEIHAAVWSEAAALRKSGALLEAVSAIRCPVVAIHGDHDPRPAAGTREPLLSVLPTARFALLHRCGHKPWQEVHARAAFYRLVEAAIGRAGGGA